MLDKALASSLVEERGEAVLQLFGAKDLVSLIRARSFQDQLVELSLDTPLWRLNFHGRNAYFATMLSAMSKKLHSILRGMFFFFILFSFSKLTPTSSFLPKTTPPSPSTLGEGDSPAGPACSRAGEKERGCKEETTRSFSGLFASTLTRQPFRLTCEGKYPSILFSFSFFFFFITNFNLFFLLSFFWRRTTGQETLAQAANALESAMQSYCIEKFERR